MRFDRARLLQRMAAAICPGGRSWPLACGLGDGTAVCRTHLQLGVTEWIAGLPTLGDVLFLSGHAQGRGPDAPLPGLLVESIELAALLPARSLVAAVAITADGPREWIECRADGGRLLARLYLLPDTDYLAWDALHAGASVRVGASGVRAGAVAWRPASAQLLRFRVRRCAGLQVLGAEAGVGASSLGRELATRIARDEVVSG